MDSAPPKVRKSVAGPGRPKGVPNKVSTTAKENFIAVFTRLGGTAEMARWAKENQTEFYRLYAKLLPVDTRVSGTLGIYAAQPIPVEERHSDALAGAARPAINCDPA